MTEVTYTVLGYDKDNDVYVKYGWFSQTVFALWRASELYEMINNGKLKRECSDGTLELIDWIEIWENWGEEGERKVWTSYEPVWKE